MQHVTVAVINESTSVSDADVRHIMAILQIQVQRDFYPVWNQDAALKVVPKGQNPPGVWWLVFLDDADQADALGYHDMTPAGQPLGKVFVKTSQQANTTLSVVASHELLEMLADPYINRAYFDAKETFYMCEVCDPCEGDQFAYKIGDVLVSDFVYPAWFTPQLVAHQLDFGKQITAPFQILAGGYIGAYQNGQWTSLGLNQQPAGDDDLLCRDRFERRQKDRINWRLSEMTQPNE